MGNFFECRSMVLAPLLWEDNLAVWLDGVDGPHDIPSSVTMMYRAGARRSRYGIPFDPTLVAERPFEVAEDARQPHLSGKPRARPEGMNLFR